jgi:hypothetical protein
MVNYEKVKEIVNKEYYNKDLSYWDKMFNQALTGNIGKFGMNSANMILNKFEKWVLNEDDRTDINKDGNIYDYEKSIEKRLKRIEGKYIKEILEKEKERKEGERLGEIGKKWKRNNNLYNYEESMENRLERLYKESGVKPTYIKK